MEPAETNEKQMRLRYPGVCRLCGVELAERQEAIYERATKTVRCVECPTEPEVAEEALGELEAEPESTVQESGAAGASALREYERRKTKREERIRTKHPKIGGLILALSDDPQSTKAWASGARGEAALGARLDKQASESIAVLHDRRIPGTKSNIDHIVVTAGGVFVVDAKRYVDKRPELRIEGGLLRPRVEKLIVGGSDRTKLVDGVLGQGERVRAALADETIDVAEVLCFIDADWPLVGAFFSTRGVRVLSPRRMSKILDEARGEVDVSAVRDRIAAAFPPA
jgi:Nuclease-related domain